MKDKRIQAGYTQQRLSDESGVALRTIQHWEAGHVDRAVVGDLKRVADLLGCKVDDLI